MVEPQAAFAENSWPWWSLNETSPPAVPLTLSWDSQNSHSSDPLGHVVATATPAGCANTPTWGMEGLTG